MRVTTGETLVTSCLTATRTGASLRHRGRRVVMQERTESYTFGPFRLDATKLVLWRENDVVSLPPKAIALLATLVRAGGDVVSTNCSHACGPT